MKTFKIKASADNLELSVAVSEPQGEKRGILQIVHGMCEHKERYYEFMEYISSQGYVCVCHDHRGHGAAARAADELGYMGKGGWKALVEDAALVTKEIRRRHPELKLTLLGHSMGSMVVRSLVKCYDKMVDCLIVCGCPSENPLKGIGKFLADSIALVCGPKSRPAILQKLSFGSFNKPFEDEGWPCAWVCSDRNILKAYHEDPLCMFRFTANGFSSLLGLMKDCYSTKSWAVQNPDMPVHFISGADDPCAISEEAINRAAEKMRRQGYSVDLKLYPEMRHEILNETDKMKVWNDILKMMA